MEPNGKFSIAGQEDHEEEHLDRAPEGYGATPLEEGAEEGAELSDDAQDTDSFL